MRGLRDGLSVRLGQKYERISLVEIGALCVRLRHNSTNVLCRRVLVARSWLLFGLEPKPSELR